MKKKGVALFIGRFQPFHKGHLEVVKQLCSQYRKVILAIGSSQYAHTRDNPFSLGERKKMIALALRDSSVKNWSFASVQDIRNHSKWVAWVESRAPPFDVVYTGNAFVASLFRKAGYPVHVVREKKGISATGIRLRMVRHATWERLVPPSAASFIKKKKLDLRVRRLR